MARITVEDCLQHMDNRFDLVLLASRRARHLANPDRPPEPLVPANNDKPTVVALREIARGLVTQATVEPEEDLDEPEITRVERVFPDPADRILDD